MWKVLCIVFKFIKSFFMRDAEISHIKEEMRDSKLSQKRTEFMMIVHIDPKEIMYIQGLYDEYKKMGGNSYLDGMYQTWLKKHCVKGKKK